MIIDRFGGHEAPLAGNGELVRIGEYQRPTFPPRRTPPAIEGLTATPWKSRWKGWRRQAL